MKRVKALVFMVLLSCLSFSGCEKESGPAPSSDARAAFLGNWSVQETWVKLSYEVIVSADTSSKMGVLIHNFADIGFSYAPAKALVSGNSITLDPNQVIGDGLVINGSGTISGTSAIHWSYTISDGATQRQVSSIYSKH
ncbi:MAG: hypothetical protein NTW31_09775 [Bacteroidetes bacterium]|nr:hypothetical protein [Bacteroidota bacterium]